MKGGITSGLVYPRAVIAIGQRYRFRNIGGTSAGAIAAALSAAAALGERRIDQSSIRKGGLERLEETADRLSGPRFIFSLFQPVPALRTAYQLLVRLSAKPPKWNVAWLVVSRSILLAPVSFLLVLAVLGVLAFIPGGARGLASAAIPAFLCATLIAIYSAVASVARQLQGNLLGMCPGTHQSDDGRPALSEWMHTEIRALAGLGEGDGPPVVFGDLWNAPLYRDEAPMAEGERTLSLEVISSDVSHSEPRTLPFAKGTFWFRESDMEALFPPSVVEAMIDRKVEPLEHAGSVYHLFPSGERLPIVVAARMSLSFPILISAVPLYEKHFTSRIPPGVAIDPRNAPDTEAGGASSLGDATEGLTAGASEKKEAGSTFNMRVCWFTDGGVSSNFPIHLFDAPMPRWPTFAIDLVAPPEGASQTRPPIFLPTGNNQGWQPRYTSINRKDGLGAIGAFLFGIIAMMQNWRDVLQSRAPGHRDRIVQVDISPEEGGMNLDMSPEVLKALAAKGALAGEALQAFDFNNHFWVRYRNLQASLERYGLELRRGFQGQPLGAEDAYDRAMRGLSNEGPYPFDTDQAGEAARRLTSLNEELDCWAHWDDTLTDGAPNPSPALRIVPIF